MPEITNASADAILKAAPTATSAPLPKSQTMMTTSWIPPRNIWAGGIAGILTWIICQLLSHFTGFVIPPDLQGYLAGAVGAGIAWIVPPSAKDLVKRLNDEIVHLAQRDPESNVSYVLPPVQPPKGEPAVIIKG